MKIIEGDFSAVTASSESVARFNSFVVEELLSGAVDALKRHGVAEANITVIRVPGARCACNEKSRGVGRL